MTSKMTIMTMMLLRLKMMMTIIINERRSHPTAATAAVEQHRSISPPCSGLNPRRVGQSGQEGRKCAVSAGSTVRTRQDRRRRPVLIQHSPAVRPTSSVQHGPAESSTGCTASPGGGTGGEILIKIPYMVAISPANPTHDQKSEGPKQTKIDCEGKSRAFIGLPVSTMSIQVLDRHGAAGTRHVRYMCFQRPRPASSNAFLAVDDPLARSRLASNPPLALLQPAPFHRPPSCTSAHFPFWDGLMMPDVLACPCELIAGEHRPCGKRVT